MIVAPYKTLFEKYSDAAVEVTVIVPLYNYQDYIVSTLDSVYDQELPKFDLIVVDDNSPDDSATVVLEWCEQKAQRFNRMSLLKHVSNAGLSVTRNTAFNAAQTEFVFALDADNLLYKRCLGRILESLRCSRAAFAYPTIEAFGDVRHLMGYLNWSPDSFLYGNYIDAMAMVRRNAWLAVDGYTVFKEGWEDYDFWCKFVEKGFYGIRIPEILARYRVHSSSMLRTETNARYEQLTRKFRALHPWLRL